MAGTKRSSWLTFRRRLVLVRRLLRSPTSGADLIAAVQAELGEQGYPAAAASALKHDLDALKGEYGCEIDFERRSGCYDLNDLGELALLDLPDTCMDALAFLEASFPPGVALPELAGIPELLERLVMLLAVDRREQHRRTRSSMRLHLAGNTGGKQIDDTVLATVKRAIACRQELAFDYLSTFDTDQPRHHRVAPYAIIFRPEGHGYLDATLLDVTPKGNETIHAAIHYRLDRMVVGSLTILPQMLPPERVLPPRWTLRYNLLPVVARRRDVATYFPDTVIDYHEDGSATVTATVTNLWQTRQILLRYGTACQVLAPPELVALFQETARGIASIYLAERNV